MIFVLRDSDSLDVAAIITTEDPWDNELQDIIDNVKEKWDEEEYPDDLFTEIIEALPDKYKVYVGMDSDFDTIWY